MKSGIARAVEREHWALAALGGILLVTLAWWTLALWPVSTSVPEWLARTRAACFGTRDDGLPSPAGWSVLIGEPLAMLSALFVIWGGAARRGLRRLWNRPAGMVLLVASGGVVAIGIGAALARVLESKAEWGSAGEYAAAVWTRVDRPAPELDLVDQTGRRLQLSSLAGRPAIVTFAYAHCQTLCPLLVRDLLQARSADPARRVALVVVTLDPLRDTPARLASIAKEWDLDGDAYVLSGTPARVDAALDRWRVARVRDSATGEVSHAGLIYVLDGGGRIAYLTGPDGKLAVRLAREF
jgi:protein SCO1/2